MIDLNKVLIDYAPTLERRIKNAVSVNSGRLKNSITVSVEGFEFIVTAEEWMIWEEFGAQPSSSKPSKAMVDRIRDWMDRAGINPRVRVRNKKGQFRAAKSNNDRNKQAYLIAKGILARGREPKAPIGSQLEQISQEIADQIGLQWQRTT
jgi:hypothetical protein